MQKGLPAECSIFGSSFLTAWLAARSEAQGAVGPAAHCRSLLFPEIQPLLLPKVQGSPMGRRWAPDGSRPQSLSAVTAAESRDTWLESGRRWTEAASGDVGERTQDVVFPAC